MYKEKGESSHTSGQVGLQFCVQSSYFKTNKN